MSADEARVAAKQLIETVPGMMQAVTAEMRHFEPPITMPHFRTLMILGRRGSCTLTEIAQWHRVSLPTMSNTVSVLVERGWIERTADPQDRRRVSLCLTDAGKGVVRGMYERVEDLVADRLASLSTEELDELKAGTAVLRRAFGSHPFNPKAGSEA